MKQLSGEQAQWLSQISFNAQGLVPVVVQDHQSQQVLMLAWMNQQALEATCLSRTMTYYSRSRAQLWVKGETSGHYQRLVSLWLDCDADALLAQVVQEGNSACHTGEVSCFFRALAQ